jgi:lysophospholipid acyltransferase
MYFNIGGFLIRTKFYKVWKLAEGACILSGLGYNGKHPATKREDWTRVQNIEISKVECPENPRMMMGAWNMNTQKWLRNHIYLRFINETHSNSGFVTLITLMTSALWHGFHLGYYMSFFFVSFYIMCGRLSRRHFRPLFVGNSQLAPYKWIYDLVGVLCSWSVMNYLVAPFQLLKLYPSVKSWSQMYFYQHFIMLGLILGFNFWGLGRVIERFGSRIGCSQEVEKKREKREHEEVKVE